MVRGRAIALIGLTLLVHHGDLFAEGSGQNFTLTVFAAASLKEAFREIASMYSRANPNITVEFSFAGSQQLVQQISEGAPADVFASADLRQMDIATRSGIIDSTTVQIFAHNKLVIIVPKTGAATHTIRDLINTGIKIVLADNAVPAGRYSLQSLDRISSDPAFGRGFKEKVLRNVVSYEENVRAVLAKVVLGEADAGIVYVSDIAGRPARDIEAIEIPDAWNAIASYPIATVKGSRHHEAAELFLRFVLSKECQSVLRRFGFLTGGSYDRSTMGRNK
jgi:molybdate transport system substrate-binding protein